MTPEDFRNVAQGAQAIIFALGAVLGALWALVRFGITKEGDRARLEVERLRNESQKMGGIESSSSNTIHKLASGTFLVHCTFEFINRGSVPIVCYYEDEPFLVNKVIDGKDYPIFKEVRRQMIVEPNHDPDTNGSFSTSISLIPNVPFKCQLSCELDEPANYVFSLILKANKTEAKLEFDKKAQQLREEYLNKYKDHPHFDESSLSYEVIEVHQYCFVGNGLTTQVSGTQQSGATS